MRATVLAGQLRAALDVASKAASKKSHIPILASLLVEATAEEGGRLTLTGTDASSRAWHTVPAKVEKVGAAVLSPDTLTRFIGAVGAADPVTIVVNEQYRATLTSGANVSKAAGLDPEDFPVPPSFDAASELRLVPSVLADLIRTTAYAAADPQSTDRPTLAGVSIAVKDGVLTLAAADGYRLAIATQPYQDAPEFCAIVPAKTLVAMVSLIDKAGGDVRLALNGSGSQVLINSDRGCLVLTTIDGQFPDFSRIIPTATVVQIVADAEQFKRALALVERIDKIDTGFKVTLMPEAEGVGVRASSLDEEAETRIQAAVTGSGVPEVKFNLGYLRAAVAAVGAERVAIGITSPTSPCTVRAAGESDGRLGIVMPMHEARAKS